jgi:hypothetical protein
MESVRWQMNIVLAQPNVSQYKRLEGSSMTALANTERSDFYGAKQQNNYLQAAASIYFLLDHQAGRQWLKRSFAFYGQNPCRKISAKQLFSQNYPDGLEGANNHFNAWLNARKFSTHRY